MYWQAQGYIERLEQEIMELQRRDGELRQILDTEDNIHFLQVKKYYSFSCFSIFFLCYLESFNDEMGREATSQHWFEVSSLFVQNFPLLSVPPEPMVPKVLINPEFSFSEITKSVSDMKDHLDDICKKELGNISKRGNQEDSNILTTERLCKRFYLIFLLLLDLYKIM